MVRILLIDEQKVIREGLRFLLESKSDIKIVAAVSNSYAAISKIDATNPDILFVGIKAFEIEGLDIIGIIRQKYPQLKIIIFSNERNEQHLSQLLEMGIKGYLPKSTPLDEIVKAIDAVDKGDTYISNVASEDRAISQISTTLSEQNFPKPEILFDDISEEIPKGEKESILTEQKNNSDTSKSDSVENKPVAIKPDTTSALSEAENQEDTTIKEIEPQNKLANSSLTPLDRSPSKPEDIPTGLQDSANNNVKDRGLNRYFPLVALASVGLLTVSLGIISLIDRSSPRLVVENAVVNGKTVEVDSPVKGRVVAVNHPQGASVTPESIIATVEPTSDRSTKQIQDRIELKQQQYNIAQESLAFLENSISNVKREIADYNPEELDDLISGIYLSQIKQKEVALETAQLRENIAKNNYESLNKLESNQISQAQINLAENSWKLAQIATEEIAVNLEIIRQEYQLVKQQIAGNNSPYGDRGLEKVSRLQKQINNQQAISDILQQEIVDLKTQLTSIPSKLEQQKTIAIKSPITGAIYNQKYSPGEVVEFAETITTIIDCDDLWVEATVKPQVSNRLSPLDSVLVTINDSDLSLQGKISSIEAVSDRSDSSLVEKAAIKTQIPTQLTNADYYKIIVEVASSENRLNEQQFCSVGKTARLSFEENEKNKQPLVSYWQPKMFLTSIMNRLNQFQR